MNRISAYIERHPFPCFLAITFSISWTLWYAAGTFSPLPPESSVLGFRWAMSQIGVFAPALAGWIVLSLTHQASSARKWSTVWVFFLPMFVLTGALSVFTYEDLYQNIPLIITTLVAGTAMVMVYVFSPSNRIFRHVFSSGSQERTGAAWAALAVLFFPAITLAANVLTYRPTGGEPLVALSGTWDEIVKRAIALFAVDLLYGGSLGEEPGWRGFALPCLQKKRSPLESSVILGFLWALWHAPIDVSHGFVMPGFGGVVARLIWTIPITLVFTFFYNRTRGSVLIAILLHTSVNYGVDLLGLTRSAAGLFFGMVLIISGCAVCADKMWHRLPTSVEEI